MAITSLFRLATAIALLLCYIAVQTKCQIVKHEHVPINFRPIIGILPINHKPQYLKSLGRICNGSILESYVKFIEGGGARVAVIRLGQPEQYYRDMMSQINGIFFPGDRVRGDKRPLYAAVKIIHKIADEINDAGLYFPLWSMLEGFPMLIRTLITDGGHYMRDCPKSDEAYPSRSEVNRGSKMFRHAPVDVLAYVHRPDIQLCMTRKDFLKFGLNKDYRVVSSTVDDGGFEVISDVEHIRKPYYSTQFDPNMVLYEWADRRMDRDRSKFIRSSQYLANFFANEARKNNNHFRNDKEESKNLIYSYTSVRDPHDDPHRFYRL